MTFHNLKGLHWFFHNRLWPSMQELGRGIRWQMGRRWACITYPVTSSFCRMQFDDVPGLRWPSKQWRFCRLVCWLIILLWLTWMMTLVEGRIVSLTIGSPLDAHSWTGLRWTKEGGQHYSNGVGCSDSGSLSTLGNRPLTNGRRCPLYLGLRLARCGWRWRCSRVLRSCYWWWVAGPQSGQWLTHTDCCSALVDVRWTCCRVD